MIMKLVSWSQIGQEVDQEGLILEEVYFDKKRITDPERKFKQSIFWRVMPVFTKNLFE